MKKLLILSGKGGTGKTTTAAAFIDFSKAKVIADCDVDAPNLHLVTHTTGKHKTTDFIGASKAYIDVQKCNACGACINACRFDAIQKMNGFCEIRDYACEGCGVCEYVCKEQAVTMMPDVAGRLDLYESDTIFSTAELKMGRGNSGKLVAAVKNQLFKAVNDIKAVDEKAEEGISRDLADTEVAIIDGSPGIGCPVMASVTGMDMVLIVTEPTVSGLSDLERLVESIAVLQVKIAVCVNKCDVSLEQTEVIKQFCYNNKILFVGQIPYDKNAGIAVNEGISIAKIECQAQKALLEIYRNTMEELIRE